MNVRVFTHGVIPGIRPVPIDGQVVLAHDFVPTPEKQAHIKEANEHFKNGKPKEALDELRIGEIEDV